MLSLVQYYNQKSMKEFGCLSFNLKKEYQLEDKQYENIKKRWKREYKKEVKNAR